MTDKTYDTRSREEILMAAHFAPFREAPGLSDFGLRELRTLDRFYGFAETRGITVPGAEDFLAFVASDRSTRRLDDLRTALDRLLPVGAPVLETVRDAIRAKRPRTRTCDRNSRGVLCDDPLMAPYRDLPSFPDVPLEDLRVLSRFLGFAEARRITVPTEADYLAFASDVGSTRRLRSLKSALERLLPGNPAVHVVLAAAIVRKTPVRTSVRPHKPRPPAARRVAMGDLPKDWLALLRKMRLGALPMHLATPAASVIASMEDTLREYARVQRDAGAPVEISVEGLRRFEAAREAHAAQRANPAYVAQGNRPATRHTGAMRLRQFGETLGLDPLLLSVLRNHESNLRRQLATVVPLKFGRLDNLPGLTATWALATDLLGKSTCAARRQTRLRLLNEAVIVALWTLLPLRLRDGQLLWGRDVCFDGTRYRIDIETEKEDEPLQGALHQVLTPFLDALVLRGMNPVWLDEMRHRAIAEELPLLRTVSGQMLAAGYPSTVWRQHFGTGAHISRARVHTELGQLGPEGVTAALALNAQRDARSAGSYQGDAVAVALRRKGQDMIDVLLEENWE
jgi:hypothetical protein